MSDEAPVTTTEETIEDKTPQLDPSQSLEWGDVQIGSPTTETEEEEETPAEEENVETTDEDEQVEEEAETVEDEPESDLGLTLEDPGEFTPKDYSFDIELDGKTHKITTPEEAAKFADDNADKFTATQILSFMRKANKMESNLERDREKFDRDKEAYQEQFEQVEAKNKAIESIGSEIEYLVSKGRLPKPASQYLTANWADPEVAKQPGVKEQVELITYMRNENDARVKAGLKPLTSAIDALNSLELERSRSTTEGARKKQAQARKEASSRVAGVSPNPVNIAPKGIAVGRSLNLNDIDSL